MPTFHTYEHSLVCEHPISLDDFSETIRRAVKALQSEELVVRFIGWWEVWQLGYIAYTRPDYSFVREEDGWLLTENRGHWLRPLPATSPAFRAIEVVHFDHAPVLRKIAIANLEAGSPIGYGPTRMSPGWDIVDSDDLAPYQEDSAMEPDAEVLKNMQLTAHGAILENPTHTIEIDRVWYWLARQRGLIAERDIEAYATGWWQERDYQGGPHGLVNLAFSAPQRIWGFHHPPAAPNARWMYLDTWPIDVKPLPANAGKAAWAVEYVVKGQQPTLTSANLAAQAPIRKLNGIANSTTLPDPRVIRGKDLATLSTPGRALLTQPVYTLAGLCGLKQLDAIADFGWECADWVAQNPVVGEQWPDAHRRYWQWLWETDQRTRYTA